MSPPGRTVLLALAGVLLSGPTLAHAASAVHQATPANVLYLPNDASAAEPMSLRQLMNATSDGSTSGGGTMPALREKAFVSTARSVGAQAGLYWRARQLQKQLMKMAPFLNRTYNDAIRAVLIQHHNYYIVPPVISGTAGGMRMDDSGRVLRIAEQTFRIERAPYFVINPPTWRDYLTMSVAPPNAHPLLLPRTSAERRIWRKGVKQGWQAGVRQADAMLRTRLARMTRDIVGMVRYHLLVIRHMVSKPIVTDRYYPVSGGGEKMSIQDSIIRIRSNPALNSDRDAWRPVPKLPNTSELFPAIYRRLRGMDE